MEMVDRSGAGPRELCQAGHLWNEENIYVPPGGSSPYCRICRKIRDLDQMYGLTLEAYEKLWDSQGGRCGICKCILEKPQIDHNHKTGKVRGLLCQKCNTGLGLFGDTVEGFTIALDYLSAGE